MLDENIYTVYVYNGCPDKKWAKSKDHRFKFFCDISIVNRKLQSANLQYSLLVPCFQVLLEPNCQRDKR